MTSHGRSWDTNKIRNCFGFGVRFKVSGFRGKDAV